MQHLAKVYRKSLSDGGAVQLLARQVSEHLWELIADMPIIETVNRIPFNEGVLVLVTLNSQGQAATVEDGTPWVLALVSQYLAQGITPAFLQEEMERAEQWRQSLTLQSQEVRRRALETAARRDEIQALEKKLQLEREELERRERDLNLQTEDLVD
jgi:hypothetical protein